MPVYELAALGAATCWALSGIVSAAPADHLGAVRFSHLRMWMVFVMLVVFLLISGNWPTIEQPGLASIALSGFIGIFVGDTALFLAMSRLGPRRTGILFAMNAPIAAMLGWVWLGEALSAKSITGIVTTIAGVVLAILFGKRPSQLHRWEQVRGPMWIGVCLGLTAAFSQALGALIVRPVMASGVDPVAASAMRIGVAALCLSVFVRMPGRGFGETGPLTVRVAGQVALSGFLAMGVGMTLILFALSGGHVGVVSTLSATSPAILLPLLWLRTSELPAAGAWAGAALVIVGSALIFAA